MNELQVFNNPEFGKLRTVTIDGEPWAVGVDVATALGYKNPKDALTKHVDPEDKMGARNATPSMGVTKCYAPSMGGRNDAPSIIDGMGRTQYPIWINESGLYSLILSSKLPAAKRFKRWVTSEVLPTLRKTGHYGVEASAITPDQCLRASEILASCKRENLPYVTSILAQGGFHVESIAQSAPQASTRNTSFAGMLLAKALSSGYTDMTTVCERTNLRVDQVIAFVNGIATPDVWESERIRIGVGKLLTELMRPVSRA